MSMAAVELKGSERASYEATVTLHSISNQPSDLVYIYWYWNPNTPAFLPVEAAFILFISPYH